jgi:hypothetical protein
MKNGVHMFAKVLITVLLLPTSFALAKKVAPNASATACGVCASGTTCCETNNQCQTPSQQCPSPIILDAYKDKDGTILLRGGKKFKCLNGLPVLHLNDNSFECEKSDKAAKKEK